MPFGKASGSVRNEDIRYTNGIDTYAEPGTQVGGLALALPPRHDFFSKHPQVATLLKREIENPLLEEGAYTDPAMRDKEGEYYLTYEAITLLIEKKIRNHKTKHQGLVYNAKHLYVIKNDLDNFKCILTELDLHAEEDAKFIVISGIHSISVYLRNSQGTIRCFIIDPEATANEPPIALMETVLEVYPSAKVVLSSTLLQKDYYSCSTFAIKALLYFVKHGSKVFEYIDSQKTIKVTNNEAQYSRLKPQDLMPALLKMSQSKLPLSELALQSIVSHKQQLSLADYSKRYTLELGTKWFNTAALVKKYRYFLVLDAYLQKSLANKALLVDRQIPLPPGLNERHEKYRRIPEIRRKTAAINPVDLYLQVKQVLDEPDKPITQDIAEQVEAIRKKFPDFRQRYEAYCAKLKSIDSEKEYRKFFFVAACCEIHDLEHLEHYDRFALKISALFPDYDLEFLRKHVSTNAKQPIHDLCLFNLPDNYDAQVTQYSYWKRLLLTHGPEATKYLAWSMHIDAVLAAQLKNGQEPSLDDLKTLIETSSYKKVNEAKELASLSLKFLRTEEEFDTNLAKLRNGLKTMDFLPEISIEGAEIDKKLAKFSFKKLPINDLRGFYLGEYTSCCQSLNKQGEFCAIHGMTSAYGAFYVVYEKETIIAQAWAWIGEGGVLVLDSWEYINKTQFYICKPFVTKAAEQFIEAGFSKVTLGNGGHTPDLNMPEDKNPGNFLTEVTYSDAATQYLVHKRANENEVGFAYDGRATQDFKHRSLFQPQISDENLAEKLSKLIAAKQVSMQDFITVIRFYYINGNEFLHKQSSANLNLILEAYAAFKYQMQQLLGLRNRQDIFLLDVVIGYDSVPLLEHLLNYGLPKALRPTQGPLEYLRHKILEKDAAVSLEYLFALDEQFENWDDLAALRVEQGYSFLLQAATLNARKCLGLMLFHLTDLDTVCALLQEYNTSDYTILHCVAQADDLDNFKRLEKLSATSVYKKLFQSLLTMEIKTYLGESKRGVTPECDAQMMTVFHCAFIAKTHTTLAYMHSQYPKVELTALITRAWFDEAIQNNNLNALVFLRNLYTDEGRWLEFLISNGSIPLTVAMREDRCDLVFFFLDSFTQLQDLHTLLLAKNKQDDVFEPFSAMAYISSITDVTARIVLIRKILSRYALDKKLLLAFLDEKGPSLVSSVINLHDLAVFQEFFWYCSAEPELFKGVLFGDNKYTLLNLVLRNLADSETRKSQAPELLKKQYMDSMFAICNTDQLKQLIATMSYPLWDNDLLPHLLRNIQKMDGGAYYKQWLNFEEAGCICTFLAGEHSQSNIALVLQAYESLYPKDQIQAFLLKNWQQVCNLIIARDNTALLAYLYPLIKTDNAKIEVLFLGAFRAADASYCARALMEWLLGNGAISDDLLIKGIFYKAGKIISRQFHFHTHHTIIMASLLWQACIKTIPGDKLCQVIFSEFQYVLYQVNYLFVYPHKIINPNVRYALKTLDDLVKIVKQQHGTALGLFTQKTARGTVFNDICNETDRNSFFSVQYMLIHLLPEERLKALNSYKPTRVCDNSNNLASLIQSYSKLDLLRELLSKIMPKTQNNSLSFFKELTAEQGELQHLLAPVADHNLYIDGKNQLKYLSEEEIDAIWEKTLLFLTKAQGKEADPLRLTYQNYYKKMKEHLSTPDNTIRGQPSTDHNLILSCLRG